MKDEEREQNIREQYKREGGYGNREADTPALLREIDRVRAEVAALKAALVEATKIAVLALTNPDYDEPADAANAYAVALGRILAIREKSAEPSRENAALLGEAKQAINTMLELWAAHFSGQLASRADEIERALNRVRRAGAHVRRALREKSDG